MSEMSDIQHRHLLVRYRRQVCRTEKRHSDIGTVLIPTSDFIPRYPTLKNKNIPPCEFEPAPLEMVHERFDIKILRLSGLKGMSDIGYQIKLYSDIRYNVGLRSFSPISLIMDIGLSAHLWLKGYNLSCKNTQITVFWRLEKVQRLGRASCHSTQVFLHNTPWCLSMKTTCCLSSYCKAFKKMLLILFLLTLLLYTL
jgi:hypothetical protein